MSAGSGAALHQLPPAAVQGEAPRQAVGQFTVGLQITQQRSITRVGHVYSDDDIATINRRVDDFQAVLDRQFIKADIVSKRAQIANHTLNLGQFKQAYDALVSKRNAGKKLTSQELSGLANYEPGVKAASEAIESLRAAIAEAERQLAT